MQQTEIQSTLPPVIRRAAASIIEVNLKIYARCLEGVNLILAAKLRYSLYLFLLLDVASCKCSSPISLEQACIGMFEHRFHQANARFALTWHGNSAESQKLISSAIR